MGREHDRFDRRHLTGQQNLVNPRSKGFWCANTSTGMTQTDSNVWLHGGATSSSTHDASEL